MKILVLTIAMTLGFWSSSTQTVAAQQPASTPTVLTVCVGTEGHTIDPAYLSDGEGGDYLQHLYEGLMKYVPVTTDGVMNEMRIEYGLAESVEQSADGLTYRFTIREDALWSDGVPIYAADFVYAWERLLATDTHGAAQMSAVLETFTAESDRVLIVTLKQSCPWFLKLCAEVYTAPVRRDLVEAHGGDWTNESNIVVSGGYTIESWVHDDHMILRKNPFYYDAAKLTTDTIGWYFADNPDRVSADFTADVPDSAATGSVDRSGVYYLYLNANAVRDWRVRAAMLLALDREAIAAAVGSGASAAWGLVPEGVSLTTGSAYHPVILPMLAWLQETYPNYDLSTYEGRCSLAVDLYNQAVASGSWSYGRTLRFRYNESAVNDIVVEQSQSDWLRVLGLTVTAQPMTAEDYGKMLVTNTFDVAYLNWVADFDDPLSFLQIMERGGTANFSAWGDERYDALLEQAAISANERDKLLFDTDSALFEAERFAVCPVYRFGECYNVSDGIAGIAHSADEGYWFGNAARNG